MRAPENFVDRSFLMGVGNEKPRGFPIENKEETQKSKSDSRETADEEEKGGGQKVSERTRSQHKTHAEAAVSDTPREQKRDEMQPPKGGGGIR